METQVYNSRDLTCKTPFGAVSCGTEITLTLRPETAEGFTACDLILNHEFAGRTEEIALTPAGEEGGRTLFTGTYTASEKPELTWYSFRFTRKTGGKIYFGRNGYCEKKTEETEKTEKTEKPENPEKPVPWQQTIYEKNKTPDWFGRGITYQIFPDRFRRTKTPDPAGMLGRRTVHENWDEPMELAEEQEVVNGDFYGGDLRGIEEKLEYLHELHVTTLYLCPIFESDSNHRYNTGDYEAIDPMLGTEADFRRLCEKAKSLGIRVMLDGVFNHTGSSSRYFNASGEYDTIGAAQSEDSEYYPWYTFKKWPEEYESWWGFSTLPSVNEKTPSYMEYIIEGKNSIIRRWLRAGADAWRLDVADELPDEFIARIRIAMEEEKPDSFLMGEVWEDGSNKIAYHERRKYLLGRETHGLMNYPFRVNALAYLRGGSAEDFAEAMEELRENYPRDAFYSGMNMLGTHDTPRALTMLGGPAKEPPTRRERLAYRLTPEERERGKKLLKAGALLMYAFPGSPTIFYGDEAGIEGYEDPMNRGTYPWGREDADLQAWYLKLGGIRTARRSLQEGDIKYLYTSNHTLVFSRAWGEEITIAAINAGDEPETLEINWAGDMAKDLISEREYQPTEGKIKIELPPLSAVLLG